MTASERVYKSFRIQKRYLDMLEKIITYKNALPENQMLGVELNERQIIEAAIESYHTQTFGGEIMGNVIPEVADTLSANIDLKFDKFFENLATVANAILLTGDTNKELLGILVQASGFNMDPIKQGRTETIEEVANESDILYEVVENIIMKKKGLD